MKSPILLNASFFLCVLLATTLPSTRARNMFDTDGNPMVSGLTYYILPVAIGRGGGPTLSKTSDETCPLTIVQDTDSSSTGLPVRLTDTAGDYHIEEDYSVRVEFVGKNIPSCVPSPALWGHVGQDLKIVESESRILFQDHSGKHTYVIAVCLDYDVFHCQRVVSVDKTLVVSANGDPWVVKFKRAYVNHGRDSWSII